MTQRRALGRGLSSLIPDAAAVPAAAGSSTPYVELDLDLVDPSPVQPRQRFSEAELEELAASIAHHGIVQPVLVRRRGQRYQVVAGERRLRAAQRAGLRKVPAVVRDVPDEHMLEVALVENIQRQELDPIDEARAYRTLLDRGGLTQQGLAERLGKASPTISNSLRLLNLSESIQSAIREGSITAGHARALLALPEGRPREELARRIVKRGLSVREAEKLAQRTERGPGKAPAKAPEEPNTRAAEEQLVRALGTRVRILRKGKGGRVEIAFHNEEELERIFDYIVRV